MSVSKTPKMPGSESSVEPVDAAAAIEMELSVVIPCLNEVETVGICVRRAREAIDRMGVHGEVIVADNGSRDGSVAAALEQGAKVVTVTERGYGAALMEGIRLSGGRYILMGDADMSYDFDELPRFLDKLRAGFDLVQGCRLPSGGGQVLPGAMPWLHRWIGNPLLSWMVRVMFPVEIHDVYCGMRGFTRNLFDRLDLRCPGMEFATEMILKAGMHGFRMAEVPITLSPDGRKTHGSHLRTFRDGWRTLRLFLIYSPRWTFLYPGVVAMAVSALGYALALPQMTWHGIAFDVHTLLVASLLALLGWQCVLLAVLARTFASREGLMSKDGWGGESWTVERGIGLALVLMCVGLALIGCVTGYWWYTGFGELDYPRTMRWVVPGVTLCGIGFQTLLASLFHGVLQIKQGNRR